MQLQKSCHSRNHSHINHSHSRMLDVVNHSTRLAGEPCQYAHRYTWASYPSSARANRGSDRTLNLVG